MDNSVKRGASYEHYKLRGYISQDELLRIRDEIKDNPDDYFYEITLPTLDSMVYELLIRRAEDLKPSKVEEALRVKIEYLNKIEEEASKFADTINKLTKYD